MVYNNSANWKYSRTFRVTTLTRLQGTNIIALARDNCQLVWVVEAMLVVLCSFRDQRAKIPFWRDG
jgi:hypothetical protein